MMKKAFFKNLKFKAMAGLMTAVIAFSAFPNNIENVKAAGTEVLTITLSDDTTWELNSTDSYYVPSSSPTDSDDISKGTVGPDSTGATASWNATTATLTLDGFTVTTGLKSISYSGSIPLNIKVSEGTSSAITGDGTADLITSDKPINITGGGELTITCGNKDAGSADLYGLTTTTLTVTSTKLTIDATSGKAPLGAATSFSAGDTYYKKTEAGKILTYDYATVTSSTGVIVSTDDTNRTLNIGASEAIELIVKTSDATSLTWNKASGVDTYLTVTDSKDTPTSKYTCTVKGKAVTTDPVTITATLSGYNFTKKYNYSVAYKGITTSFATDGANNLYSPAMSSSSLTAANLNTLLGVSSMSASDKEKYDGGTAKLILHSTKPTVDSTATTKFTAAATSGYTIAYFKLSLDKVLTTAGGVSATTALTSTSDIGDIAITITPTSDMQNAATYEILRLDTAAAASATKLTSNTSTGTTKTVSFSTKVFNSDTIYAIAYKPGSGTTPISNPKTYTEQSPSSNYFKAKLFTDNATYTLNSVIKSILTTDEQTKVSNGGAGYVWLTSADAKSTISDTIKNKMKDTLGTYTSSDYWLDINLYKKVVNADGTTATPETKLTTLSNTNSSGLSNVSYTTVKVSIDISDKPELQGHKSYYVCRYHKDASGSESYTPIRAYYNSSTKVLTFDTDRFSYYNIGYTDSDNASVKESSSTTGNGTNSGDGIKTDSVKTADLNSFALYIILIFIAFGTMLAFCCITYLKNRNNDV